MSFEIIAGLVTAEYLSRHEDDLNAAHTSGRFIKPEHMDVARTEVARLNDKGLKQGAASFAMAAVGIGICIAFPAITAVGLLVTAGGLGLGLPAIGNFNRAEVLGEVITASERRAEAMATPVRGEKQGSSNLRNRRLNGSFNAGSKRPVAAADTAPQRKLGDAVMDVIFGKKSGPG